MPNNLDLATVILLQKTAYIVGVVTFVYLWLTSSKQASLILLAIGFAIMAVGSTLAGIGEWGRISERMWQLGSLSLGLWGYAFIWMGQKALSQRRFTRLSMLSLAPATLIIIVAIVTHFEEVNAYRAATFNLVAATAFLASAVQYAIDFKNDPLRSRQMMIAINGLAGLLALAAGLGFIDPRLMLLTPLSVFFFVIVLNFTLVLFTAVMISDRAHTKLRRQADTDHLTGISNRRSFFMHFIATPNPGDVVLLLDLDHFKKVNDRFGHIAGDVVLKTVASRIKHCMRSQDLLARYGGEEFIVLLPNTGAQQAEVVCERIRHAIGSEPIVSGDETISITVSIGAAIADQQCETLQELINAADKKLYEAKHQGRDRVEIEDFKVAA
ncbi:diguanylate cyclase (GGDEF) domain-containing protein [Cohaesibacter marisflavi]|uniref:diguanylate cyclase n=1 Tax=Cohaesibacter marisflavi TaxID=655353 RepID=A0A1I5D782_9HYPH|nr:GGDEF domain-containing protein [Cohaesibacter marisflavi]SFN95108.1 diguanylate cyclase (GGDEF) domain-containing protein [Cohaesibacter marisflavi]